MNLFMDGETIPSQDPAVHAEIAAKITHPGNISKPETIAQWRAEKFPALLEEAIHDTGLDGTLGQIAVIGWAIDDKPVRSLQVDDLSLLAERDMLIAWINIIKQLHTGSSGSRPCLIGHNINFFDIPFIWKRCIVHGVRPPMWFPRDPKPWGESTYDTMTQWAGIKGRISLDRLCRALGIPSSKKGIDGSMVWQFIKDGRIDDVAKYCRDDVECTRSVYRRMTFTDPAPLLLQTVPVASVQNTLLSPLIQADLLDNPFL